MSTSHAWIAAALGLVLAAGPAVSGASITPVGVLDYRVGGAGSHASAISPDGRIVVGDSRDAQGIDQPVEWTAASGLVQLANPSGRPSYATGVGVQGNGDVVIAGNIGGVARRWLSTTGAWMALPPISDCTTSPANALAISADGNDAWIAGNARVRPGGCGTSAMYVGHRYQLSTHTFTYTCDQTSQCSFYGVAADGTMVGRQVVTDQGDRAIYWPGEGVPRQITPLAGTLSQARAISTNGRSIVGYTSTRTGITRAFAWEIGAPACTDLGTLPGDDASMALAVSADGSVVGGYSTSGARSAPAASLATIWLAGQPASLQGLLAEAGADLSGWVALNSIKSISANGRVVCGDGWYDRDGGGPAAAVQMGYVAVVPEPATALLLGLACLPALRRRARG
jgi:probable HAF family extracellular repeat protein